MTDGWRQIDAIFQAALERDPSDRAAFLDEALVLCDLHELGYSAVGCRRRLS